MSTTYDKYKMGVRRFGRVNWVGFYTLYFKEVQRFFSVWIQTIVSPIITLLLFLTVFSIAIGSDREDILGHKFTTFLVPGLIAMQIMQNAFANTSSSLMISKIQGNIVDILFPPLSPGEVTFALILGGITRGIVVGFFSILVSLIFIKIPFNHFFYVITYATLGSCLLAALGFIAGLWSEKFDNMAAVTNFIVVPLSFLSGTFFSISRLEGPFYILSQFNPFFYIIDGFRFGFLGQSDANIYNGLIILLICNVFLLTVCYLLFKNGYKIKS
ncbi:MAG: multidrug ABC transporter permease [Candidatus Pelagibacter sp.]|nr:multidrug ABC transporter permease [Candidatus Pelagibacter sp.]OUV88566.1 MAG: multidrug ABC transporter permease [Pelagibacteraceae bacterium TMED136]|tara:strand:- start:1431 stop:2243 length:813 start_codon:yes stop_codon:yes gene_type:complete